MTDTRQEAEKCAANMTGFAIPIIAIIEILYYSFELFKVCKPQSVSTATYLSANYNEGNYTGHIMRRATRSVQRAARLNGQNLSYDDEHRLVIAALDHCRTADESTIVACCATPCQVSQDPDE